MQLLEELRGFLWARDDDFVRIFIENYNLLSVENAEIVYLTKLPKDIL